MMEDASTSLMYFFLPCCPTPPFVFRNELPTLALRGDVHVLRWLKKNVPGALNKTSKWAMYGAAVSTGNLQVFKDVRELMSDVEPRSIYESPTLAIDRAGQTAIGEFHSHILTFLVSEHSEKSKRYRYGWVHWMVDAVNQGNIEAMHILRRHCPYQEVLVLRALEYLTQSIYRHPAIVDLDNEVCDESVALLISWILDPSSEDTTALVHDLMRHDSNDLGVIEKYDEGALAMLDFSDWSSAGGARALLRNIIRARRDHYLNNYNPSPTVFGRPLKRARTS